MSDAEWDWERMLASPAFWASYYELFLDDEDEDEDEDDVDEDDDDEYEDEDEDDEVDEDEDDPPRSDRGERATARRLFGVDPRDGMNFEAKLHNHAAASREYYRKLLDEAGGDLEGALEKLVAESPFAEFDLAGTRAS